MKLWIGSANPALNHPLKTYFLREGWWQSSCGNYHHIELPRTALKDFSRELSRIFLEKLLPSLLIHALYGAAPDLSAAEKESVLNRMIGSLGDSGTLSQMRTTLAERILLLTYETDLLTPEGILSFRCKDLLRDAEMLLARALEEYRSKKEKHRLLALLREYARQKAPELSFLRVQETDGAYHLFDESHRRILILFSEEYTPEEKLINSLLYISPTALDLTGLQNPELKALLTEIFPERIFDR